MEKRSGEETFGRLMLAIAAVIFAARLVGTALHRIGQPQVMGEVLAGILLGPTLLGAIAPEVQAYLFPPDIVPLLSAAAQIGLAFYLFLVGMEIDPRLLRERIAQAALISNTSVAFPLALGFLAAIPTYELLAPDNEYLPFALFMGVSMSVTAFPVLARILIERRMLRRPVGALALASAAIDDVTAWGLLALATAVAGTGSGIDALVIVGLAGAFTAGMILVGRPLLARVSTAYDEVGRVPPLWLGIIFVSVLLSAFVAQQIGIAAIFGAFVMGLIMPRHAGLTEDVTGRIEDFVTTVLLPLFFVVTGLRTEIGALDRAELWLITLGLIAVAIVGKWVGAMGAARYGGFRWRDSAALGALMNTRGLTELIVLNIGLELGLISSTLFTMLVVMALVTTFMAGPALRLIDPRGALSAPPEEELRGALQELRAGQELTEVPRSILVAPQDSRNLEALLSVAEPLARSEPRRELILARLLVPQRYVTGLAGDDRDLRRASEELAGRGRTLGEWGIAVRTIAFTTPDAGEDLVRLAGEETIDLLLLDGRRPLLGVGRAAGRGRTCARGRAVRRRRARRAGAGRDPDRRRPRRLRAVRRRRPRLGGARARRVDRARTEGAAPPAGGGVQCRAGRARREHAARERLTRRPAARRRDARAAARQPRAGRAPHGAGRRSARGRALRALARRRARAAPHGAREVGSGPDAARPPRHALQRARRPRGRHAVSLV